MSTNIDKLPRHERDRLARQALAAKQAKREQNRRARARRKARDEIRIEKWVPRAQAADLRRLIDLYLAAREGGLALSVAAAPRSEGPGGWLITGGDGTLPAVQAPGVPMPGIDAKPEDNHAVLRARFHDPGHTNELRAAIAAMALAEGPLPLAVLELAIARQHGFATTGRQIRERIAACLDAVEIHREDGCPFVWAQGSVAARTPWRGRGARPVADISRHEWASLIDDHADRLAGAADPVRELARLAGVKSLTAPTRRHLDAQYAWWRGNGGEGG